MSLRQALSLYEQSKDPSAALTQCREIYNDKNNNSNSGGDSGEMKSEEEEWIKRHNEGLLSWLDLLRQSRSVNRHDGDKQQQEADSTQEQTTATSSPPNLLSALVAEINNPTKEEWSEYSKLTATYNRCLLHFNDNANVIDYDDADGDEVLTQFLLPTISKFMNQKQEEEMTTMMMGHPEMTVLVVRMVFLTLDTILRKHEGNGVGVRPIIFATLHHDNNKEGEEAVSVTTTSLTPQEIIHWMETCVLSAIKHSDNTTTDSSVWINQDELKFRLHLYKSKLLFLGTSRDDNNDASSSSSDNIATRTRLSRKELKSAMDLHQNKLSLENNENDTTTMNNKQQKNNNVNDDGVVEKRRNKQQHLANNNNNHNHNGSKPSKKGGGGSGSQKFNKSRGGSTNQSDVSSVTSVAGGSLVTSTSEGLWNATAAAAAANVEKKGMVATFEGMPHKVVGAGGGTSTTSGHPQTTQHMTTTTTTVQEKEKIKKENHPDIHVQHEGVLYLKAELECLRGNTTKSLKLCSEARLAGRRSRGGEPTPTNEGNDDGKKSNSSSEEEKKQEMSSNNEGKMASQYDEAIYYNNLALVHHTAGKFHLALHYYSLALNCISDVFEHDVKDGRSHCFWSNGTARPDITPEILSNTSLCAFQAGDFETAHECMESCMSMAPGVYGKRPRCWLRMGQSCIGE